MKKLIIPSILAIVIIFAGIFAFSPVNQASTVHGTVQNTQQGIIIKSGSGANITDGDTVIIDCDQNFIVEEMYWSLTDFDSVVGEQLDMGNNNIVAGLVIDGLSITEDNGDIDQQVLFDADVNGRDNVTAVISWRANAAQEANSGNNSEIYPSILSASGAGTNDIVINLYDSGANSLDASDTLTVTASILTQNNAICSVTVNS